MTETLLILFAALLLDRLLGEPRRAHPLAGFGRLATWLEGRLNPGARASAAGGRLRGLLALALLVLPPLGLLLALLDWPLNPALSLALNIAVLYFAIGGRSLAEHARRVRDALREDDMARARAATACLVSRDTAAMKRGDMLRATIESTLENGSDALFAPLFWFLLAGAPGALGYRLVNTLDAMWGYRTPRYRHFGWAAARLDDVLNFVPARLTALSYALAGRFGNALRCWFSQAGQCASPNAGPVMAAGAGALALQLGGPAVYHGRLRERPRLGRGAPPRGGDIDQALGLVRRSLALWLGVLILIQAAQIWGGGLA